MEKNRIFFLTGLFFSCIALTPVWTESPKSKKNLQSIHLDFSGQRLEDVISQLHELTGINFVIDQEILSRSDDYELGSFKLVRSMTLKHMLGWILKSVKSERKLTWRLQDEAVYITFRNKGRSKRLITVLYDINDLKILSDLKEEDFTELIKNSLSDGRTEAF